MQGMQIGRVSGHAQESKLFGYADLIAYVISNCEVRDHEFLIILALYI